MIPDRNAQMRRVLVRDHGKPVGRPWPRPLVAGAHIVTVPPAGWLAAAVLGTLVVVAVLTSIPARAGARRPVADVLQAEVA